MKLPVLLLAGSVSANAVVLAVCAFRPGLAPPVLRHLFQDHAAISATDDANLIRALHAADARAGAAAAQAAARAQLWAGLQSDDLATLVARLRAAGFPPALVRAIVGARIEARFAARMKALAGDVAATPFWKPEPLGLNNNPKSVEERNQLYRERAKLLRDLLGSDYFAGSGGDPTAAQRRRFGDLSPEKIALLQRINDDYLELGAQIRASLQGITLPVDREALALLEREKHTDLAAILTPQELADYEMRTSPLTSRLSPALTLMDATEAEFRAIYGIEQPLADRLYPMLGVKGAEMAQQRRDAQQQAADQLAAALGPERAAEFARAGNYEFQQLSRLAQRENLPADAAVRTFTLRDAAAQESTRIATDPTMANEAKLAALQTLAQSTRAQIVATLGANAGNAYVQSADWLNYIQQGGYVKFSADGTGATFSSLPTPTK
jgi:hypothetical protein